MANNSWYTNSQFNFRMEVIPQKAQPCPTSLSESPLESWEYDGIYTSLSFHIDARTFNKIEGAFNVRVSVGTELVRSSVFAQEFDSALQSAEMIHEQVLLLLEKALVEAKVNYDLVEDAVSALKGQGVYENHAWYAEDRKWVGMLGGRMRYQWRVQGNKIILFESKVGIVKGYDGSNYPPKPMTVIEFERNLDTTVSFTFILGFTLGMEKNERNAVRAELDKFQYAN